jgi:hypothetical protein
MTFTMLGCAGCGKVGSGDRMTKILASVVRQMQRLMRGDSAFPPELFTNYRYIRGADRVCHLRVVQLIKRAAAELPGVTPSASEQELGKNPRWRPDVVLRDSMDRILGVIEYESLNSSDSRVVEKDVCGYEGSQHMEPPKAEGLPECQ